LVTRWFAIGFFLSAANLAKEITHLCCWHKKSKEKIYDVHHYNRLEFRAALKQFQDAIGGLFRILWFFWGLFIFWTSRTSGCRTGYGENVDYTAGYLKWSAISYWFIMFLYLLRIPVFSGYLCCRQKKLTKEYNEKAQLYGFGKASEEYANDYKSILAKKKNKHGKF